ncbi:MAG: phosphoglucosamine mutase [Bacteroidetes bacterium GWE2_29_8]|nr:MAG: phosphoglucosamine mutase [Bacteroidetes bacterium GWE2_29_8]OFY24868.1 MAG: phosphoglucosamine mutase [Bacteroidetes bacterium GWF2_29_10]
MTLITSISGIRGTIGGDLNNNLTPIDIVKFTYAYSKLLIEEKPNGRVKVVVGRDGRISGEIVSNLICSTLNSMGIDVINVGLSTTPTVEIAVTELQSDGGVIITASHNPKQWNALKLLNNKGEFISGLEGQKIINIASKNDFIFNQVDNLGNTTFNNEMIDVHIEKILALDLVNKHDIAKKNYKIAVDCINSTGAISIPTLLNKLGVKNYTLINDSDFGNFKHNPEPLKEHLEEICSLIKNNDYDLGIVVDPDVDRLAFIDENGEMFGEEYTLVAVADYVLKHKKGNTVSNLSSSMALKDVTELNGGSYYSAAVGEVNVVSQMRKCNAIIGGEGNGGVIYPELHYGRDSLVGIALFLSHLSDLNIKCSELKKRYPYYHISKNKIELNSGINVDDIILKISKKYQQKEQIDIDGLKIIFNKEWVHLRKSNTEPIIRIYAESTSEENSNKLALEIIKDIENLII